MTKKVRHFLDLNKINYKEIRKILDLSKSYKQGISSGYGTLKRKTLCLIFEKPSTRTRVSFEIAMHQLGGNVSILEEEKTKLSYLKSNFFPLIHVFVVYLGFIIFCFLFKIFSNSTFKNS